LFVYSFFYLPVVHIGQSHSGGASVVSTGVDPNIQLLPPIAERDAESTEKALRAVAGILGQTGKVVTAALKQAKSRNDKLQELVLGSEQLLLREVETSDDAISKIQSYFKVSLFCFEYARFYFLISLI
jgi:hypothetical protein